MIQLTLDTQVSDIVTALPQSADLFRNLRIDYCCGGKIALKEAAEQRELNPEEVLKKIHAIEAKRETRNSLEPSSFGSKTLVAHIQEKYHANLCEELPMLAPYITKVARVHGENHPHLLRVQEIFKTLRAELIEHTEDEDKNVFPLLLEFLENPTSELKERVKPHVFELEEEHDNAGRLLHELREITDNFTPPETACGTYRLVYARLEQLEKETFEHVHLENNVLFDRVRELI
ncbi:iron-sulfur cluster repair di-iron protein [Sporosarcina highlanderae]|uniref:Iron-sulfur cluster repair di-iron protein n=1 Tax=Sporosarcina highlanderae TaxID=3035916 RepID=A0ABT8JM62_9BACL|nr:iron-sulfur cluster repair di-iron protein [Sporosarcina highlanderae]MDN4606132.1 iron-sulfur cluster repair di-iron protein [Sporosarcina highlanderae]